MFDALAEDNPCARFDALDKGVRSGGHRGTTWHAWRGPDWACVISSATAKHGKHHSQLTFCDRAEMREARGEPTRAAGGGGWAAGGPRGGGRAGETLVGGGFDGRVGGVGGAGGAGARSDARREKKRALGAVGHQRHIDHVYVARGDGVRDSSRDDVQVRVRVVRARVVVDCASADVKAPGESLCACGFDSLRLAEFDVETFRNHACAPCAICII